MSLVLVDLRFDARHYAFLCLGVLLVFLLFLTYYYGQPFEAKHHAMRRTSNAGRTWIVAQRFNILGLVGVGIALKSILSHLPIPGNGWEDSSSSSEQGDGGGAVHDRRRLAGGATTADEEETGGLQRGEEWMLCVCLTLSLVSLSLSRMQHRGWDWEVGVGANAEGAAELPRSSQSGHGSADSKEEEGE